MRSLLLLVVAAMLGAGCVGSGATLDPAEGAEKEPAPPAPRERAPQEPVQPAEPTAPPPEEKEEATFCESEEECDFWDEDYHEYVLYNVDTVEIDVLIAPSASADSADDTRVIRAAVDAWGAGIRKLGEAWFADSFRMNVYVLGEDQPPAAAIEDPELIVLAAEYNPFVLFGIGLEPKQLGCMALGEETLRAYPVHAHGGMEIIASDCTGVGFVCFAANTNFLQGSAVYLHDLVAHEVGHCLGGGHVGDALDFKAKRVPVSDIMSYQHDDDQIHCVSNLNVRVLEALYAPVVGEEVLTPLAAGDHFTLPRIEYEQVECALP